MVPENENENFEFFSGWLEQTFGQIEGSNNVLGPHPLLLSNSLSKERKEPNAPTGAVKKNLTKDTWDMYVALAYIFLFNYGISIIIPDRLLHVCQHYITPTT